MQHGNLIVLREPVRGRIQGVAALHLHGITAGLQYQHPPPLLRQARGERPTPRAGTDDDVFVFCAHTPLLFFYVFDLRASSKTRSGPIYPRH
ncbi:MAG: hypothetical protein USCGTAYLOR_00922 [Chromatiales bacterium USCg_Taylor]|nr:MAG: hypothetical protein USCGTAYLOR_00922 [Chromatiales bacterium USCg_Taylor]